MKVSMIRKFVSVCLNATWGKYTKILERRPLLTQSITTGVVSASGDVVSQIVIQRNKEYNLENSIRFFAIGTFVFGPWMRYWYLFLNKVVTGPAALRGIKMVAADQLIMPPIFIAAFIVIYNGLCQRPISDTKYDFQHKYRELLTNSYKVWPLAQLVNFYVVPIQFRVLFANCVALLWNCYLSSLVNRVPKNAVVSDAKAAPVTMSE